MMGLMLRSRQPWPCSARPSVRAMCSLRMHATASHARVMCPTAIHAASESPLVNPFPVRGVRRVKSRWVRVTQHDVCEAYAALIAYEGPPELAVSSVASRFGLSHAEEDDPASVHALPCEALEAIESGGGCGRGWMCVSSVCVTRVAAMVRTCVCGLVCRQPRPRLRGGASGRMLGTDVSRVCDGLVSRCSLWRSSG